MMRHVLRRCLLLAGVLVTGCGPSPQVQSLSGFAQGTTYHIRLWSSQGMDTAALQQIVTTELTRLDRLLSNYRPDSVIEQFNSSDGTEPFLVGSEIVQLVRQARRVSEATHGCYDLTVKPLFDLWGFNSDVLMPPADTTLQKLMVTTGFKYLATPSEETLSKSMAAVRVDLSSIAQGYSVGRIAAMLEQQGIENYLVEIGGELQTRGSRPGGDSWRVAVERPLPGERSLQKVLTIKRSDPLAIMTSGTYRHFFDKNGKRYSHVLNAHTGKPVNHATVSVTVLHGDPSQADAWSTALLCLGREAGMRTADQVGIAALFIDAEQGNFQEYTSRAWADLKDVMMQ